MMSQHIDDKMTSECQINSKMPGRLHLINMKLLYKLLVQFYFKIYDIGFTIENRPFSRTAANKNSKFILSHAINSIFQGR